MQALENRIPPPIVTALFGLLMLAKDAADVKKVGIQGTPTFFVNGTLLTKFGPEPLLELVQSELQKVR